jgi:hypothetical protein
MSQGTEGSEEAQGNYLFWALLGTGFVVLVGCTALLNKMDERPDLAAADPALVTVLQVFRIAAGLGLAVIAVLMLLPLKESPKD